MPKSKNIKKNLPYVILAVIVVAIVILVLVMTLGKKTNSKVNTNNKVNIVNIAQNNNSGNNRGGNNSINKKRRNTEQLNLDTLCSNYLDFVDRIIEGNVQDYDAQFEDFVYSEDKNQRMEGCRTSFKKVHRIEEDIPQENKVKQQYFEKINQCLLKSNSMTDYINCIRDI